MMHILELLLSGDVDKVLFVISEATFFSSSSCFASSSQVGPIKRIIIDREATLGK